MLARLELRAPGDRGHGNAVAFSPDGRELATSGAENTVMVWNAAQ
jgi:WD40 repeat protein